MRTDRKTYHGFPSPYARLIESPEQFQFTPMQIDTWHREKMNISADSPKFFPGPQPRNSLAVHSDALYSGLLECPFTTRLTKSFPDDAHSVQLTGTCAYPVTDASSCFAGAAAAIGGVSAFTNSSGSNTSMPAGCSAAVSSGGTVQVFWNEAKAAAGCGASDASVVSPLRTSSVACDVGDLR